MFNKRDLMEQFKSQFKQTKGGDFVPESKAFFNAIAKSAFVGDVATEFSKYETVTFEGYVFRPNIDSDSRFSALLQAIHKEEPDLLSSAVAKGVHDRLDHRPGGLPVANDKGQKWKLSGDDTLNPETLAVARQAVAQSQKNVIGAYQVPGALDHPALYQSVWAYTPRGLPAPSDNRPSSTGGGGDSAIRSTRRGPPPRTR